MAGLLAYTADLFMALNLFHYALCWRVASYGCTSLDLHSYDGLV